jgi:Na+-driven multidrug efflux pump
MILAFIGGALLIVSGIYTWGLSKVRELYEPDDTHIVATIGFGLIEAAVLAACLAGELPIKAFWVLFGLSIIAAIPIYYWREREKRIQRHKREEG